jgi:hypothetical protein
MTLDNLKVQSFVTELEDPQRPAILGGEGPENISLFNAVTSNSAPIPSLTPLVIASHHKAGTNVLNDLLKRIGRSITEKRGLRNIVIGRSRDRKIPLSMILGSHKGCDCYVNIWFEHPVDVPADSIRLLHFVRDPVKWVRSAYLYHKKGAPCDPLRWLDWKVFQHDGEPQSYFELLNRVDTNLGLSIEAIRSFPEILATAQVARTSSGLIHRQQISLEQLHEDFDETIRRLCMFVGFTEKEAGELVRELKYLDLSAAGTLPVNVTRTDSASGELERTLAEDSSFAKLFGSAAEDMGFTLPRTHREASTLLPDTIVKELLEGRPHFLTSAYFAQWSKPFMQAQDSKTWWIAYGLQEIGVGHLMMHGFIQEMLDKNSGSR